MSMLSLLPGMEGLKRFEDEGDTNINVVVGDPEAAAQAVEDSATETEAATDVAETAAESEAAAETSDTVEELLARLEVHQNYLEKYGYTKEFAMLANYNGFYDKVMENKYSFPAAESLSVAVNPLNADTKAALEGISDTVRAVWDWIKKMCAKIAGWFKKIGGFIVDLFRTQIGKINHLTELYKKLGAKKDDDQIKDRKIFAEKDYNDLKTDIDAIKASTNDLKVTSDAINLVANGVKAIETPSGMPTTANADKAWSDERTKDQRKDANDKFKKNVDNIKSKIKSPDTNLKDCSLGDGEAILKIAKDECAYFNKVKDNAKIIDKLAKMLDASSTKLAKIDDPKADTVRRARYATTHLLKDQSQFNTALSIINQLINASIKGAAAIASIHKTA